MGEHAGREQTALTDQVRDSVKPNMRLMMLMSHPFCISFKGNAERFVFSIETLDHGYLLFSYTTCS